MSTVAFAQLTNARDVAPPGTSTTTSSPGLKTYVDAFAALVPSEVLTLHALIISITTKTDPSTAATTIPLDAAATLKWAFWGLIVLSVALYVATRYFGGKWDNFDWIRASIAPLAFIGWTMLQRATAFDAAFPQVPTVPRTVGALFLGAVLGGVTAALAAQADAKNPPPPPAVVAAH